MASVRIARHHLSLPFLSLELAEFVVLIVSFYGAAHLSQLGTGVSPAAAIAAEDGTLWARMFAFGAVMLSSLFALGLYQSTSREGFAGVVARTAVGLLMGAAVLALLFYAVPVLYTGRGLLLAATFFSFVGVLLVRMVFMSVIDQSRFKRRVLVLGAGERAASIDRTLRRRADRRGFRIIGYLRPPRSRLAVDAQVNKIVAIEKPLVDHLEDFEAQEIVVAMDERRKSFPISELLDCKLKGASIIELSDFFERESGKVKLDQLSPSWLIYSEGFKGGWLSDFITRVFDIVVSLALLLVAWPFMFVTAIAIKLECRGVRPCPIIYRQRRVGLNGEVFEVLKFRSMRTDAEQDGRPQWAQKNDSRVTGVGGVIRKLRIDELPQLINVFKGEMSFVGPRPERPEFVKELSDKLPYYSERHRVKPGITGWAQLRYPYGSSDRDALEKLQFDLYYAKNKTLILNLVIVFQTVEVILFGKGAR